LPLLLLSVSYLFRFEFLVYFFFSSSGPFLETLYKAVKTGSMDF
jgi:hypothetical protein